MNLKYTLQSLRWVKALFSPFKPFKVSFYAGKTQVGVPYFLPRKWVPFTREDALEKATKVSQMSGSIYFGKDPNTIVDEFTRYTKAVPLKVGFSYCSLGWKTKWTSTDFRHEWNPILSFVFFGYQIVAIVYQKDSSHYWEAWLYYEYATDKTKSKRERVAQCRKEHNQTWTSHKQGEEPVTTDYYTKILRSKYL